MNLGCPFQGCVFTRDINKAIMISDAMESGTVQINSAPARGPDHFPFQVLSSYSVYGSTPPWITLLQEVSFLLPVAI
jgi:acyl-CoA reductase-like NAD-dependent aldehyde dehydrogenase